MRTLLALVIAGIVLTGGPAFAGPRDPAPGVRAPGSGRLVAPADLHPARYRAFPSPGVPKSNLMVSYHMTSASSQARFASAVNLQCEPAGGAHPAAPAACVALQRAGANPGKLIPATTACVLIYAPVTAQIAGSWRGKPVKWSHRYGNTCEMRRATGVLFKF
jgi:hypothetical protein